MNCIRCGSPLKTEVGGGCWKCTGWKCTGWKCTDETCPFHTHEQYCSNGWIGYPGDSQEEIKCLCIPLTPEEIKAIADADEKLEEKFSKAIKVLKRRLEKATAIANALHNNGLRYCGKSRDEDFQRSKPLERAADMLTDLREWY